MYNPKQKIDRVRYFIFVDENSKTEIDEPNGWEDDDYELARHRDYLGIIPTLSNSLRYNGLAKTLIDSEYYSRGLNAEMFLEKWERHQYTDEFVKKYYGQFDFTQINIEKHQTSIKFNSLGIVKDLKNNQNKKTDITVLENIYGSQISSLPVKKLTLKGKSIPRTSEWNNNNNTSGVDRSFTTESGNWDKQTFTWRVNIPVEVNDEINDLQDKGFTAQTTFSGYDRIGGRRSDVDGFLNAERRFLYVGQNFEGSLQININCNFWFEESRSRGYDPNYRLHLVRAGFSGSDFIVKDYKVIHQQLDWSGTKAAFNEAKTFTFDNVVQNDSFYLIANYDCYLRDRRVGAGRGRLNLTHHFSNISISVYTEDTIPATLCDCYTVLDLIKYMSKYITKNLANVESSVFESGGEFYNHVFTNGLSIRGGKLDNIQASSDGFKPPQTSFKDVVQSLMHSHGVSLGMHKNELGEEFFVLEKIDWFFDKENIIDLGEVSNMKIYVSNDDVYSEIEAGYEKGDDLDGIDNLNEFNTQSKFNLPIHSTDKKKSKISKFITGPYLTEFTRIQQINEQNKSSYTTDNDLFMFDCKEQAFVDGNYSYTPKLISDLNNRVSGVKFISDSFNFFFSPINMFYRNSQLLLSPIARELSSAKLKFLSSLRESGMSSWFNEKNSIIYDGADNDLSSFNEPIVESEFHEFNKVLDPDTFEKINSVNKSGKPGFYSMFKYKYQGVDYYGFLWSLKPKKEGTWKMKKAYRYE